MIEETVRKIMTSTDMTLAVFNLVDYVNFPFEIQEAQFKILESMANHMSEARANDIIKR